MAQQLTMKSRPLGKDEVVFLLDLISKNKAITTKATNATNNKLKEYAWKTIAREFSAMAGEMRRPEQTGKTYIPPDETLDRVASMLGTTCTGFTVEFGGDGVEQVVLGPISTTNGVEDPDLEPLPEIPQTEPFEHVLTSGDIVPEYCGGSSAGNGGGSTDVQENETNFTTKKFIFNTPKNSLNKRRKLAEEIQLAQRDKELAMAAYFRAKAHKIELENAKLELELEQLKKSK